jgi:hypothetical protein
MACPAIGPCVRHLKREDMRVIFSIDEVDEQSFLDADGIDLLLFDEHLPELHCAAPPSCGGHTPAGIRS